MKIDALQKAKALGQTEDEIFFNKGQQQVQWKFICITDLYQINDLKDGVEIYSRIEEKENAASYLQLIRKKFETIRFENKPELLNPA